YVEQIEALIEGGVDLLQPETSIDTLNIKAAIYAYERVMEKRADRVPLVLSVTITDASGRTLSGQTVDAFWISVRHARPFCVGVNCALGARAMRPHVQALSRMADCFVHCYPNAGLPNPLSESGYDETPEHTSGALEDFGKDRLINLAGGCCGTTPAHIAEVVKRLSPYK